MRPHGCQYSYLPRVHNGSAKHSRVVGNIFAFMTHRTSPVVPLRKVFEKGAKKDCDIEAVSGLAMFGCIRVRGCYQLTWQSLEHSTCSCEDGNAIAEVAQLEGSSQRPWPQSPEAHM